MHIWGHGFWIYARVSFLTVLAASPPLIFSILGDVNHLDSLLVFVSYHATWMLNGGPVCMQVKPWCYVYGPSDSYAPPKGACIVPPCCDVSSFLAIWGTPENCSNHVTFLTDACFCIMHWSSNACNTSITAVLSLMEEIPLLCYKLYPSDFLLKFSLTCVFVVKKHYWSKYIQYII
jgi:hypothetical protein